MASRPPFIIDAGPALNFLASGHQRLLTSAIGGQTLHAPAVVEEEVLRKASKVAKFSGTTGRWKKMKPQWIKVLSDDSQDPGLQAAARALLTTPLVTRQQNNDDLGETMVVLHAYARAAAGQMVIVIIDDQQGRRFAKRAIQAVERMRTAGAPFGRVMLTSTTDLIEQRINTAEIADVRALRKIWAKISAMDDGLPNALPDRLLQSSRWEGPQRP